MCRTGVLLWCVLLRARMYIRCSSTLHSRSWVPQVCTDPTWLPSRKVAVLVLPELRHTLAPSRAVAGPVSVALSASRTAQHEMRE